MTALTPRQEEMAGTHMVERLYGDSHLLNDAGQYVYDGKVGGCRLDFDNPEDR